MSHDKENYMWNAKLTNRECVKSTGVAGEGGRERMAKSEAYVSENQWKWREAFTVEAGKL